MLLFLVSCAEKDPVTIGKLECKVDVSMVTATTAKVTVTVPRNEKNFIKGVQPYYDVFLISPQGEEYIEDICAVYVPTGADSISYFFSKLTPETTYKVGVEIKTEFNKELSPDYNDYAADEAEFHYYWDHDLICYSTDYTFTTPKDGDYSNLGITFEPYFMNENHTFFCLTFHDDLFSNSTSQTFCWGYSPNYFPNYLSIDVMDYDKKNWYIRTDRNFNKGEKIYFELVFNYGGVYESQTIKLHPYMVFDPEKLIIQNPEFKTIFNGNDYCLGSISWADNSDIIVDYYIRDGDYYGADKMQLRAEFGSNCYLWFSRKYPSQPYFLQATGIIRNYRDTYQSIFSTDFSNHIEPAKEGEYLYSLNMENQSDGSIKFTISCDDMFSFCNVSSNTKLRFSPYNYEVEYHSYTSNTVEFILPANLVSSCFEGNTECNITTSDIIIKYNDTKFGIDGSWLWSLPLQTIIPDYAKQGGVVY